MRFHRRAAAVVASEGFTGLVRRGALVLDKGARGVRLERGAERLAEGAR